MSLITILEFSTNAERKSAGVSNKPAGATVLPWPNHGGHVNTSFTTCAGDSVPAGTFHGDSVPAGTFHGDSVPAGTFH